MVAQVSDWFQRFSEPIRLKPSLHVSRQPFSVRNSYFGGPDPHIVGWYVRLSEPVRSRPPLGPSRVPFFFRVLSAADYRFSLTETGDIAALSFAAYTVRNQARVTITEEPVSTAQVTIQEIRYDRRYS